MGWKTTRGWGSVYIHALRGGWPPEEASESCKPSSETDQTVESQAVEMSPSSADTSDHELGEHIGPVRVAAFAVVRAGHGEVAIARIARRFSIRPHIGGGCPIFRFSPVSGECPCSMGRPRGRW